MFYVFEDFLLRITFDSDQFITYLFIYLIYPPNQSLTY